MGAVEILIVYENLDTMRYVLRVHGAESNGAENGKNLQIPLEVLLKGEPIKWSNALHIVIDEKILYLTPEQEKDKSHFTDKEVSTMSRSGCPSWHASNFMCVSQTGQEHELIESMPLLEWFANNYKKFGATLEIVTDKSQEGSQFVKGFGGIGGEYNVIWW